MKARRVRGKTDAAAHGQAVPQERANASRMQRRLGQLYEISKLLVTFESIDSTVPQLLAIVSRWMPVRAVILTLRPGPGVAARSVAWSAEDVDGAELGVASAHARAALDYLVGWSPTTTEEAETLRLPASPSFGGPGSSVVLPLVIEHEIFGASYVEAACSLDEGDLAFLSAMVNQLAVALHRHSVVEARERSELRERRAAELLAAASVALFSSLSYATTLDTALRVGVPALGDVCILDEVGSDGVLARAGAVVVGESRQHFVEQICAMGPSPDAAGHQARVMAAGTSTLFAHADYTLFDERRARLAQELGVRSVMIVPLVARGRIFGLLTLVSTDPVRVFGPRDLTLADELGRRVALALDNAALYEKAQREILARQDLMAIVSHDLRNPLNAIQLSAQLLGEDPLVSPVEQRRRVDAIERSSSRMERIISDLLDLASIETGHLVIAMMRHVAASVVREALDIQQSLATHRGLRLCVDVDDDAREIDCDRGRLLQVFGNLIGNAIKFTPWGGTVTLAARGEGESVVFSVTDTGPGIAADEVPHVFDRYWQAKKTARLGTGLGLSIAQRLVHAHDGRIWVESVLGQGAKFSFTVPVSPRRPSQPAVRLV